MAASFSFAKVLGSLEILSFLFALFFHQSNLIAFAILFYLFLQPDQNLPNLSHVRWHVRSIECRGRWQQKGYLVSLKTFLVWRKLKCFCALGDRKSVV